MHRMEKMKMTGIIDMLRYAVEDLSAEGLSGNNESKNAAGDINAAIDYIEKWEAKEVETDDITMAISMLQKALEKIPEEIPGEARESVESAIADLKEEEKAAGPGAGNFEPQL